MHISVHQCTKDASAELESQILLIGGVVTIKYRLPLPGRGWNFKRETRGGRAISILQSTNSLRLSELTEQHQAEQTVSLYAVIPPESKASRLHVHLTKQVACSSTVILQNHNRSPRLAYTLQERTAFRTRLSSVSSFSPKKGIPHPRSSVNLLLTHHSNTKHLRKLRHTFTA